MKNRLISAILSLLLLFSFPVFAEETVLSCTITSIAKDDGGAVLDVKMKDLLSSGLAYGDLFSVELPNGSMILSPLMEELKDVSAGSFCLYAPKTQLRLGYNGDTVEKILALKKGDVLQLTLIGPGLYREAFVMNNLEGIAKRKHSESDASYANFRMVSGGNLLPGLLYRGSHPVNGEDRARYMQDLITEAGISCVLNLSDTEESMAEWEAEGLYAQLYAQGRIFCAGMDDTDLTSPVFQQQLAASLTALAYMDGPCLIHCIYGKDRTGMVCAILQALCGASYEEIQADYLLSYENWYGLTPEDEAYGYAASIISDWLSQALGISNLSSGELASAARSYLHSCGMTETALDALILRLTGQAPVPLEPSAASAIPLDASEETQFFH